MPVLHFEIQAPTPNRYIEDFIAPNRGQLSELAELTRELDAERQGWMNSPDAERLADAWLDCIVRNRLSHRPFNAKERRGFIEKRKQILFGEGKIWTPLVIASVKKIQQFPARVREELDRLGDQELELVNSYESAVAPLVDPKQRVTDVLVRRWREFVSADFRNLLCFSLFLLADEEQELREEHRPFLRALQQHRQEVLKSERVDVIDQIKRHLLDKEASEPNSVVFRAFIILLQQGDGPRRANYINILSWLRLISFPSSEIDPNTVYEKIKAAGEFPVDLKNLYLKTIEDALIFPTSAIREYLSRYSVTPNSLIEFQYSPAPTESSNGEEKEKNGVDKRFKGNEAKESPSKRQYELYLPDGNPATNEALERFVDKKADDLAGSNEDMRHDIVAILNSLAEAPYGFGIKKMVDRWVALEDSRRVPLRRFAPNGRINLDLKHPEAWRLRVTFFIDSRKPSQVHLQKLMHHTEFDKEFLS